MTLEPDTSSFASETGGVLTDEEVAAAHSAGKDAGEQFEASLASLRELLASADQVEILARAGIQATLAQRPRKRKSAAIELQIFHVELLQALSLADERQQDRTLRDFPALASSAMTLIDQNQRAYRNKSKAKITSDVAENAKRDLIDLVRGWTLAVRGPRHPQQTRRYVSEIATQVEAVFRNAYGCGALAVVEALETVVTLTEKRLQTLIEETGPWVTKSSPKTMLETYVAGLSSEDAAAVRANVSSFADKLPQVQAHLWNRMESAYAPLLTFRFEDLASTAPSVDREALKRVLNSLSYDFGELGGDALEHLHLDNPVRLRPLIRLADGVYFCPCPPIIGVGLSEIFQALCNRAPKTAKRLEDARAQWLEHRLEILVAKHLPRADLRRSVEWLDADGVTSWESDVVAVMDKTVFVFEAKSGKVSPPARRGAENSLKRDLHKLVGEASIQSSRLKALIEGSSTPLTFETSKGPWTIDPAEVRDVVRVNVLLDTIGPLSAHWPRLMQCGLLRTADIAPSMSIFELETIFEVLTLQLERCHYLSRRADLERTSAYIADELDLLALYLDTQFNLGEQEFGKTPMQLYGLSENLARAYAMSGDDPPVLPIKRRALWRSLLQTLETLAHPGWTRFGHRLLNVNYGGQVQFERLVATGWKKIRHKGPATFFTSGITAGLPRRPEALGFCIGSSDPPLFNDALNHGTLSATKPANLDNALMIYWFRPKTDHGHAYDFIGVLRRASREDVIAGKVREPMIAVGGGPGHAVPSQTGDQPRISPSND